MLVSIMKKIAIIGLGSIAKRHAENIKTIYPDSVILGVSSSGNLSSTHIQNIDRLSTDIRQCKEFHPEFAIVASPATFHLQHAKYLLEANIPVLIEKPIAANSDDALLLISTCMKANLPASVGYCLRYLPAASVMKMILEQKEIGTIYNVMSHVGQFLPDWRTDKDHQFTVSASKKLGGGALLELSHELDYLQWLLGELDLKYAMLRHSQELKLEVEEIADLMLTTPTGVVCNVHMDFIQKKPQRYCEMIGEKGRVVWNLLENRISIFSKNDEHIVFNQPSWDKNNMYMFMLREFIRRVEVHDINHEILMDAHRTIKLIETIKSKADWGVTL